MEASWGRNCSELEREKLKDVCGKGLGGSREDVCVLALVGLDERDSWVACVASP
jgi:hypothetical protein